MTTRHASLSTEPVLTPDRYRRVQAAECAWFRRYVQVLRRVPGNPLGVEIEELAEGCFAVAFAASPTDSFRHKVIGAENVPDAGLPALVDRARAFYAALGNPAGDREGRDGQIDTVPGFVSAARRQVLDRHGVVRTTMQMAQYWGLARDASDTLAGLAERGVVVRQWQTGDLDHFLRIFVAAEEMDLAPGLTLHDVARAEAGGADDDEWTVFVAEVDGVPQAIGMLHVAPGGSVGSCSGAWTHPDGRGRGAQLGVLLARISAAHARGCELVLSQTGATIDNASARNIQRAGMRLAWITPSLAL